MLACVAAATGAEPFPTTYQPLPSDPTLITNATVLTGDGQRLENTDLYLENGKVM